MENRHPLSASHWRVGFLCLATKSTAEKAGCSLLTLLAFVFLTFPPKYVCGMLTMKDMWVFYFYNCTKLSKCQMFYILYNVFFFQKVLSYRHDTFFYSFSCLSFGIFVLWALVSQRQIYKPLLFARTCNKI